MMRTFKIHSLSNLQVDGTTLLTTVPRLLDHLPYPHDTRFIIGSLCLYPLHPPPTHCLRQSPTCSLSPWAQFVFSGVYISYNLCLCLSDLHHLAQCPQGPSLLLPMAGPPSFSVAGWHRAVCVWTRHIFCIHSRTDGQLGDRVSAVVDSGAMSMRGRCIFESVVSSPSEKYWDMKLLDHGVVLFLILWRIPILFSTVAAPIYVPTTKSKGSLSSASLSMLLLFLVFFTTAILTGVRSYLIVVLLCISSNYLNS